MPIPDSQPPTAPTGLTATANGTRITLRLTNQEMANMIGTTRETVNRTLNRFWDEQLVDMRTSHVVVVEPEKLKALTDPANYLGAAPAMVDHMLARRAHGKNA